MKILVATDGSKPAMHAVKFAIGLVPQLHSKSSSITLINVHDDTGLRHAKAVVEKNGVKDYLHDLSEEELKPARKLLDGAGIRHDIEIGVGHVAQTIVEFAEKGKFEMIVMGHKGRGAVADLLTGSVAQRVMATAGPPVLLVK